MSDQSIRKFLDEDAILVLDRPKVKVWLTPGAYSHPDNRIKAKALADLIFIYGDSFAGTALRLPVNSYPARFVGIEYPSLAFWVYKPSSGGPYYFLGIKRFSEDRHWQYYLEAAHRA